MQKLCKYYERYAAEGKSIANMEIGRYKDELEIERQTKESIKDMVKQEEKYEILPIISLTPQSALVSFCPKFSYKSIFLGN